MIEVGKQVCRCRGHRLTPAASTQVKAGQTRGLPIVTSCSLLPLGSGFPMERGLRDGDRELCFLPTAPHPMQHHSFWKGAVGRAENKGCAMEGRMQREPAGFPSAPSPGSPSGWPHPAPSSRSTLTFRQPWSSSVAPWFSWPGFLQMDGKDWLQGLSFQRPSWVYRVRRSLRPPPLNLPNLSTNLISRHDPASACCVILSKRLDLSAFQAIKWGEQC